jgi:hypothetical protein
MLLFEKISFNNMKTGPEKTIKAEGNIWQKLKYSTQDAGPPASCEPACSQPWLCTSTPYFLFNASMSSQYRVFIWERK